MKAIISIGSNIGDRLAAIGRAVALIESSFSVRAQVSAPYRSAAWGYESTNEFINVALAIDIPDGIDPDALLSTLLSIEHAISTAAHRKPDGTYADRLIDIDLIALENTVCSSATIELPHPRMHLRRFVLEPMMEVAPRWVHPLLRLTPAEMLQALE